MSQPRYYWYEAVKKMIKMYPKIKNEHTVQATIFGHAIEDALEETKKLPNGDLRVKAVMDILIDQTSTYEGVGLQIHYDWRTIQNWVNSFVKLVGKKAGY